MEKYTVLESYNTDNGMVEAGSIVELTPEAAKPLIDSGAIAPATGEAPSNDGGEGAATAAVASNDEVKTTGNAVLYEIISKETNEIFPVERLGSGDVEGDGDQDLIVHKENGEEVVFTQPGHVNDAYLIRARDTKLAPNGVDLVLLEGEEAPAAQ